MGIKSCLSNSGIKNIKTNKYVEKDDLDAFFLIEICNFAMSTQQEQ